MVFRMFTMIVSDTTQSCKQLTWEQDISINCFSMLQIPITHQLQWYKGHMTIPYNWPRNDVQPKNCPQNKEPIRIYLMWSKGYLTITCTYNCILSTLCKTDAYKFNGHLSLHGRFTDVLQQLLGKTLFLKSTKKPNLHFAFGWIFYPVLWKPNDPRRKPRLEKIS